MRRPIRGLITAALALALTRVFTPTLVAAPPTEPGPWPVARAQAWAGEHPWLVGCNFAPSTAINQLEMWQADTFDLATIDRELGWAEGLGFNSVRVFLHHLPWEKDSQGFLHRIEQFLATADRHKIGVMFVLFDGVWDPFPHSGKQHRPQPGLHNSGWVQSPGRGDPQGPRAARRAEGLRHRRHRPLPRPTGESMPGTCSTSPTTRTASSYGRYEPANKAELSLALLRKEFAWARSVEPQQPLTAGVWAGDLTSPERLSPINRFMLDQSDVISFHNYKPLPEMKRDVESLKRYGRPLFCTEYMARPAGSRFDPDPGLSQVRARGAYNWGFVAGKTQTIYPWDSWQKPYADRAPRLVPRHLPARWHAV